MNLVMNVKRSQLRGVLEELEGVFSNMDIVINIKEEEYKEKIPNLTTENLEQIQKAIEQRDRQDESRAIGPLKPADDAIVIDTTDLNIEQVVGELLCRVEEECLKKD